MQILMPHNLSFYIITSAMSQDESPGKQALRWRPSDERFIRACPWDSHLRKGKEVARTGWREKWSCSAVLTCMTYLS